jgi:hypothetical protein
VIASLHCTTKEENNPLTFNMLLIFLVEGMVGDERPEFDRVELKNPLIQ